MNAESRISSKPIWLSVTFVVIVLGAVIFVPLYVNARMNRIRETNAAYVDPATRLSEQILTGLIGEFSDLSGGRFDFDNYKEHRAKVEAALTELHPLAMALRPETFYAYLRLRDAVDDWHYQLDTYVSSDQGTRQNLQKLFAERENVVHTIRQAAERFQSELNEGVAERRARIVSMERLNVSITMILSMSALLALAVVARLARRLHDACREAQQATQARDDILRIVSHDLRNPVNVVSMASNQIREHKTSKKEIDRFTQIIERSTQRMNGLIQELLDVGKMEAGRPLGIRREFHDIRSIVGEAYESSQLAAARKSIQFTSQVANEVTTVYADRQRVLQVLSNLIDNAIKFTPEGGRITLTCRLLNDDVRFEVSDTGIGVAPEDQPRIFEVYRQVGRTHHSGVGLGLAIAKRIIEEHRGRLWVESQPGLGSTFHFTIPTKAAHEVTNVAS
jgi:signal transduction histidine kinase